MLRYTPVWSFVLHKETNTFKTEQILLAEIRTDLAACPKVAANHLPQAESADQ